MKCSKSKSDVFSSLVLITTGPISAKCCTLVTLLFAEPLSSCSQVLGSISALDSTPSLELFIDKPVWLFCLQGLFLALHLELYCIPSLAPLCSDFYSHHVPSLCLCLTWRRSFSWSSPLTSWACMYVVKCLALSSSENHGSTLRW